MSTVRKRRTAAESAGDSLARDGSAVLDVGKPGVSSSCNIALIGHFDPETISSHLDTHGQKLLAGLSGPPAVPIHHLAAGFASRAINVAVVGGIRKAPDLYVETDALSAVIYNLRGSRAFTLTGYRRERKAILRRLEQIRPEIAHAHWTMEGARAVADWDGPKVLTIHDALYEHVRISWSWRPGAAAFRSRWIFNTLAVLRRFEHIIAVSPFVESYLRLRHNFRGEIRVVPNIVPPLPEGVKPESKFPKTGQITFACYGGPDPLKNVGNAISAFHAVRLAVPECRLVVFGDGWDGIRAKYDPRVIEFRGLVPHGEFLRALSAEIDIWVHPSRMEAHPITICEAIQAGCPVIAGAASAGVPWTLDYGKAGVLVNVDRPIEIAEAMKALATDHGRSLELVSYGRNMILRRFSPDQILNMHLDYYDDIKRRWKTQKRVR